MSKCSKNVGFFFLDDLDPLFLPSSRRGNRDFFLGFFVTVTEESLSLSESAFEKEMIKFAQKIKIFFTK